MNQERAREFFSAYYEDTLEKGLKQTFEQKLQNDAHLQAEYASFQETMMQLDSLKFEEIEIPITLSDKIATRLEEVQEKQRSRTPAWSLWLRGFAFGGVATVAIVSAVLSLNMNTDGPSQAGLVSGGSERLNVSVDAERNTNLRYRADRQETVSISSKGDVLNSVELRQGQLLRSPLVNDQPHAAVFELDAANRKAWIAVPGNQRSTTKAGSGSLGDLIAAIAGFYRVPVQLEVEDETRTVTWIFESSKGVDAAREALAESYSVSELEGGVIQIRDR